ncbi:MAG: hypothetical protein ACRD5B_17050 [Nitrososphaeraceae archaeon]
MMIDVERPAAGAAVHAAFSAKYGCGIKQYLQNKEYDRSKKDYKNLKKQKSLWSLG